MQVGDTVWNVGPVHVQGDNGERFTLPRYTPWRVFQAKENGEVVVMAMEGPCRGEHITSRAALFTSERPVVEDIARVARKAVEAEQGQALPPVRVVESANSKNFESMCAGLAGQGYVMHSSACSTLSEAYDCAPFWQAIYVLQ